MPWLAGLLLAAACLRPCAGAEECEGAGARGPEPLEDNGGVDSGEGLQASFLQKGIEFDKVLSTRPRGAALASVDANLGVAQKAEAEAKFGATLLLRLQEVLAQGPEWLRTSDDPRVKGLQLVDMGTGVAQTWGESVQGIDSYSDYAVLCAISCGVWTLLVALWAMLCYSPFHHTDVQDRSKLERDPWKIFEDGLFDCFFEMDIRIWFNSTCCMMLVWAETVSKTWIHSFWFAFLLFTICGLLNMFTLCVYYFGFFTLCLMVYFRQRLRRKLHLDSLSMDSCVEDCCFAVWCPCAVVAHEAQVVELCIEQQVAGFV